MEDNGDRERGRAKDAYYDPPSDNWPTRAIKRTIKEYSGDRDYRARPEYGGNEERSYVKLFNGGFWKTVFASLLTAAIGAVSWGIVELINLRNAISSTELRLNHVATSCESDIEDSFRRIERIEDRLWGRNNSPH